MGEPVESRGNLRSRVTDRTFMYVLTPSHQPVQYPGLPSELYEIWKKFGGFQ